MRRRHPRHAESGAALVEFALVLPLLMMLLLGTATAGLAWNRSMTLSHGARESARYAATLPLSQYADIDTWLDAVAARTESSVSGELAAGQPGRSVCVAYVYPSGTTAPDVTRRRVATAAGIVRSAAACYADGQAAGERRVQVVVERTAVLDTGLWSQDLTLHSEVVFRFEANSGL